VFLGVEVFVRDLFLVLESLDVGQSLILHRDYGRIHRLLHLDRALPGDSRRHSRLGRLLLALVLHPQEVSEDIVVAVLVRL